MRAWGVSVSSSVAVLSGDILAAVKEIEKLLTTTYTERVLIRWGPFRSRSLRWKGEKHLLA
jgi:hypothetical protein